MTGDGHGDRPGEIGNIQTHGDERSRSERDHTELASHLERYERGVERPAVSVLADGAVPGLLQCLFEGNVVGGGVAAQLLRASDPCVARQQRSNRIQHIALLIRQIELHNQPFGRLSRRRAIRLSCVS